jgi:hypothetical protein
MPSDFPLLPATIVVRSPEQLSADLDGKTVLLSIGSGEYYNMNVVGTRIWELVEQPIAVSSITSRLLEEFEVESDVCEKQVTSYLTRLQKDNLIQEAVPPAA